MGMEPVKLTKPWLTFVAGDTVEVDPLRAQWLRDHGYAPTKKRTELEPRPMEPELQSPFPGVEVVPPPAPPAVEKRRRKGEEV